MGKRRKRKSPMFLTPPHRGSVILTETLPTIQRRQQAEISKAMGVPERLLKTDMTGRLRHR